MWIRCSFLSSPTAPPKVAFTICMKKKESAPKEAYIKKRLISKNHITIAENSKYKPVLNLGTLPPVQEPNHI